MLNFVRCTFFKLRFVQTCFEQNLLMLFKHCVGLCMCHIVVILQCLYRVVTILQLLTFFANHDE